MAAPLLSALTQAPMRLIVWLTGGKLPPLAVVESHKEIGKLADGRRRRGLNPAEERIRAGVALAMLLAPLRGLLHVAMFVFWTGAALSVNIAMYVVLFRPQPPAFTLVPRLGLRAATRLARRWCPPEMGSDAPLVDGGVYRLFDRCADRTEHYGTMMAFVPPTEATAQATGEMPAVLLLAGGNNILCESVECIDVARWLRARGVASFVVFYRTTLHGHNFHVMVADCVRAVQLCRHNARRWRLRSISVMGFSAGAHFATMLTSRRWEPSAAMVACHDDISRVSCRPDALLLMQGPTHGAIVGKIMRDKAELERMLERLDFGRHDWPQSLDDPEAYDALRQIDADWPPTLLAHALEDTVVPVAQSSELFEALRALGVDTELIVQTDDGAILDATQHAFALSVRVRRKQPVTLMWFAFVFYLALREAMEYLPTEAAVKVCYQVLWRCNFALLNAEMRVSVLERCLKHIVNAPLSKS